MSVANLVGTIIVAVWLIQDLAGSERLSSSGAGNDKDRLKETQAINKSLSALADVVSALGKAGDNNDKTVHIPYRNSKVSPSALLNCYRGHPSSEALGQPFSSIKQRNLS